MINSITGNAIVFGVDFPILEILLILNFVMFFYVIIIMFEIKSLIKLRKDLEEIIHKPKTSGIVYTRQKTGRIE